MEENSPTFLKVTEIIWDNSKEDIKELPKELELQWNAKDWNRDLVSYWISQHFNIKVNSLNIKELQNKASTG